MNSLHPNLRVDIIGELQRRFAGSIFEIENLADHATMIDFMQSENDYYVEDNEPLRTEPLGSLDTYPRGLIMEAVAKILTGREWPCGFHSADYTNEFFDDLEVALSARDLFARPTDVIGQPLD